MVDYSALLVGVAAVISAGGAVMTGVLTGRTARAKDRAAAETTLEALHHAREQAEEVASTARIVELARDAKEARAVLREREAAYEVQTRGLRAYSQRGWDLASYHFGLVGFLAALLANIIAVMEAAERAETGERRLSESRLAQAVKQTREQLCGRRVPVTLEEPIPPPGFVLQVDTASNA